MKQRILIIGLALLAVAACRHTGSVPRETIGLVQRIVKDSSGLREIAARAGWSGADGAIALLGEPGDVVALAQRFRTADIVDNVDGKSKPDSLPDFIGETIQALLDVTGAPYGRFIGSPEALDSLRELAVLGALHAWDTVCYRSYTGRGIPNKKASAKILVLASSLQAEYGLFDVDTLLQMAGGKCRVLSPMDIILDKALDSGMQNILVWTSEKVREAKVWGHAISRRNAPDVTLTVFTPQPASDVRAQLRDVLRQYLVPGLPLDAIVLDVYGLDLKALQEELDVIRAGETEEDAALNKVLSAHVRFFEPAEAVMYVTFHLLREDNLFARRIAKPVVKYYESAESDSGQAFLVEAPATYVNSTYVPSLY